MYATDTQHMAPPIDVFGDVSQMLSAVSANARPASAGLAGGEAVVSFGAFTLPTKTHRWELWALRRKVQMQVMRSVVEVAPTTAVIALDVTEGDATRAKGLGRRLAQDLPYVSKTRYGHRLPTVVVLAGDGDGCEALASTLLRGDFHGSETYREVVIDAADLPRAGRPGRWQMSAA